MEQYIRISTINDFLFCPRSLYLHSVYESYDTSMYHDEPQIVGTQLHQAVDTQRYSTAKHILQGLSVASTEYGILGKIDLYDTKKRVLTERKTQVKRIFDGYRMQLYAQYVCMREMGYEVLYMTLYDMTANKRHVLMPPNEQMLRRLKDILRQMRDITPEKIQQHQCRRCDEHIYGGLSW